MRKFRLAFMAVAGFFLVGAIAPPAFATLTVRKPTLTVTWVINDKTDEQIAIAFYSQNRSHAWPAPGRNWPLKAGENRFTLTCESGEQICFGAWNNSNPSGGHWGVGMGNKYSCKRCCASCDGGTYAQGLDD